MWRHSCISLSGTELCTVFLLFTLHLFYWSIESDSTWQEMLFYCVLLLLKIGLWAIGTNRLFWTLIPFPCKYAWSTLHASFLMRTNVYWSSEVIGSLATFHIAFVCYCRWMGVLYKATRTIRLLRCWEAQGRMSNCALRGICVDPSLSSCNKPLPTVSWNPQPLPPLLPRHCHASQSAQ